MRFTTTAIVNTITPAAVDEQLLLSLRTCAAAQRAGKVAAVVLPHDVAIDSVVIIDTARAAAVDLERLVISRPDNEEGAAHVIAELTRANAVDLIITITR